ncbi:MAG: Integrase catalytic region [Paenibacillaceae bacterium]|nr:Integrase catalytic region [Paenibacillaceae bacterium]
MKNFDKPDKYAEVKQDILRIFRDENKCRRGYRAVTLELRRTRHINHKTVQRLMKELGLFCMVRAKKYRSYKGEVGKVAPNLLNRDFTAKRPNEKWATDITEFSLFGKKLYLSTIIDLYNSEIVSYTISPHPRLSLVMDMLNQAVDRLPRQHALILHSDQGWHYQMKAYQRVLEANHISQSMSRKGNCLDNAVQENFFGILKSELLYIQQFDSIEHFIQELHNYMHWYNHRRTKEKLKGMSPVEYRTHSCGVA